MSFVQVSADGGDRADAGAQAAPDALCRDPVSHSVLPQLRRDGSRDVLEAKRGQRCR